MDYASMLGMQGGNAQAAQLGMQALNGTAGQALLGGAGARIPQAVNFGTTSGGQPGQGGQSVQNLLAQAQAQVAARPALAAPAPAPMPVVAQQPAAVPASAAPAASPPPWLQQHPNWTPEYADSLSPGLAGLLYGGQPEAGNPASAMALAAAVPQRINAGDNIYRQAWYNGWTAQQHGVTG